MRRSRTNIVVLLLPVCLVTGAVASWHTPGHAQSLPAFKVDPALIAPPAKSRREIESTAPVSTSRQEAQVKPVAPPPEVTTLPIQPIAPPAIPPAPSVTPAGATSPARPPTPAPPATSPVRPPTPAPATSPAPSTSLASPATSTPAAVPVPPTSHTPQATPAPAESRSPREPPETVKPPQREPGEQERATPPTPEPGPAGAAPPERQHSESAAGAVDHGESELGADSEIAADPEGPDTTYLRADRLRGLVDVEAEALGNAELRRGNTTVFGDSLMYRQIEGVVEAVGNVKLTQDQDIVTGPRARLRLADHVGFIEEPRYSITRAPAGRDKKDAVTASGNAERVDFLGENRYLLAGARYSTCGPDDPDWYLQVGDLALDFEREVGVAHDIKLVFKDVPILYSPWADFPLNNQRKSGLLAPTVGDTTSTGFDVTVPYYWNIAPEYDATLAPRVMSRRGVQLGGQFRYLGRSYSGIAQAEWLPNDRLTNDQRSFLSWQHGHALAPGLNGSLNVSAVSDDTYFADLATRITNTSQRNLLRQGNLTYHGDWWNSALVVQSYQTLQDPSLPPVEVPYDRLPWLTARANYAAHRHATLLFAGEFANFRHPDQPEGMRTVLYPQIALPVVDAATYFIPKFGLSFSRYDLERGTAGTPAQFTRSLPVVSVDSGVIFERDATWLDRSMVQTLEPRLYYLYIPFEDQSDYPVFDTAEADFNFTQIFSENTFVGQDRIADANQLTAAVSTRMIDSAEGGEVVRAMLGQRFYFSNRRVTLPGQPASAEHTSDLLAAVAGRISRSVSMEAAWEYNPHENRSERVNVAARYQPGYARVLNGSFRFTDDLVKGFDLSGQWPLARGLYGVGRYNYSLLDRRLVEAIAGLEFDGGCWIGRAVYQRFATATQEVNNAFFVQLELNGLSRIGSSPLDLLRRSIPGYGRIDQSVADPVFGSE
jgi:LPS-assembly protein